MSEIENKWGSNIQSNQYILADDFVQKSGLTGRHVQWLKQERSGLAKVGVLLLTALETLLLSASLIGIPLVFKAVKTSNRLDNYKKFEAAEKRPPNQSLALELKTDTQTFNHTTDYVLENGFIWFRDRNKVDREWTPLYFDGFPTEKPVKIQADGANLIVVDNLNQVHYKKILKEKLRIFEKEAFESEPPKGKKLKLVSHGTNEFTIKNNFIWVRSSENKDAKWQPFFFGGWPDKQPKSLEINGNTLRITDQEGVCYGEDVSANELKEKLKGQSYPYTYHYSYSAINKDSRDNWKDRWFSLPYLNVFVNFFCGKKLKVPKNTIDIAISNRGPYSGYWKDSVGIEHPTYIQVTTLYSLCEGENFIRFADPWLPFGFSLKSFPMVRPKKIDLPTDFKAEKLCASASTLFVYGTNAAKEPKLLCRLADFDTEKINPFLPYGDEDKIGKIADKKTVKPELRILPHNYVETSPDKLWTLIPLEGLNVEGVNFKEITIVQTGLGNEARELRIKGSNEADKEGFYKKSVSDIESGWEFIPFASDELEPIG